LEVVNQLLNDLRAPTKEMVRDLVELELAYINTNHPDYVGHKGIMKVQKRFADKKEKAVQANLPVCPYDGKCYRENPQHFQEYAHPVQNRQMTPEEQKKQEQILRDLKKQDEAKKQIEEQRKTEANRGGAWIFNWWGEKEETKTPSNPNQNAASSKHHQPNLSQSALQKPGSVLVNQQRTEDEDFNLDLTEYTIKSYFNKVVRRNMKDKVPKTIMYLLVNKSKESIQSQLIREMYKAEKIDSLMEESSDVAQRRAELAKMVKVLTAAQSILMEVQDYRVR